MRTTALLLTVGLLLQFLAPAARAQDITIKPTTRPILSGHLKMGGKDPKGNELNADSQSFTLNGKPIYPIMGEFHYTRYPRAEWERELLKMKAGGITVVSTYLIWIHHEEVEGQWEWSDNHDLRAFVELCGKLGLQVWIRLGPWDHSEVRSGGLPDWVVAKCTRVRTTRDQQFMDFTKIWYQQIFEQVKGLFYKYGGPIIGVQVDNEVRNDPAYLLALKNMAKDIGFDAPYYSMTGWGPAKVPPDELLPMFGGYTDGFWIAGNTVAPASTVQFFFTHNPSDEGTTNRTRPGPAPASLDYLQRYPYLTCETNGGMAIAYARRPLMSWQDIAASSLAKVGDGSNLMGYYMYHGGADPLGKLTTLQETQTTKTTNDNDLPPITYDFQAPLGQFGQVRDSFNALRLMHMFLADFGPDLCSMPSYLPDEMPRTIQDNDTLRWAARSDGHRGYIFINNYQRNVDLSAKTAQFHLHLADGDQTVPAAAMDIPSGSFMAMPFNFAMNGANLKYATAQLICMIEAGPTPLWVFFVPDGVKPEFAFDSKTAMTIDAPGATITDANGIKTVTGFKPGPDCVMRLETPERGGAKILLLTRQQAMHLWKANLFGRERLLMSPANLVAGDASLSISSDDRSDMHVSMYPGSLQPIVIAGKTIEGAPDGLFTRFAATLPAKQISLDVKQTAQGAPAPAIQMGVKKKPLPPDDAAYATAATWQVTIPKDALDGAASVRLRIDYTGDAARAYIGDKFVDDDFYFGQPWEIGLNRFAPDVLEKGITLKILPLRKDSPVAIDPAKMPSFNDKGEALEMRSVTAVVEYELKMEAAK